jgi:hypothetical protein
MLVYHFLNRQYGLECIRLRRLKIATLNDLNDPFELLAAKAENANERDRFQFVKDGLAKNCGLLCFSKDWKNPVQWSHYADGHRGLCLGFDVPTDRLTRVQYIPKRIDPNMEALEAGGSDAQEEMRRLLTTKYSHWRYEREVRCFIGFDNAIPSKRLRFFSYSEGVCLKEVIVGYRSDISRSELAKALGSLGKSVKAMKARLAFRSFKVIRQKKESLWL